MTNLEQAIENRLVVELSYGGGMRIVEPYVLFVDKEGCHLVRVYQVTGHTSHPGTLPSWRSFKVEDITELRVLRTNFRPTFERQKGIMGLDAAKVLAAISSFVPDVPLYDKAVYTIAHINELEHAYAKGGRHKFTEKKPWVRPTKWIEEARQRGESVPLILADSCDCTQLLYWARLLSVQTGEHGTTYEFDSMVKLDAGLTPQDLKLVDSGQQIAPGFIRPYALVSTPSFLTDYEAGDA